MSAEFNPKSPWQYHGCLSARLSVQMGLQVWKIQQDQKHYVLKFTRSVASAQIKQAHADELGFYRQSSTNHFYLDYQILKVEDFKDVDNAMRGFENEGGSEILVLPYVTVLQEGSGNSRSVTETFNLFLLICQKIKALHDWGYIHGDLKLQHIFCTEDGVGLLDFAQAQSITSCDGVLQKGGTPAYMAPELFIGQAKSIQSDLYALGIIFYQLMMKIKPYVGNTYEAWAILHCQQPIPELPQQFKVYQDILDGLLAKQKQNRFLNADRLIDALKNI